MANQQTMTSWNFIFKGVKHYRAGYLGVLAGAAVGAMVLLGALMAGDSVKANLRKSAELRTGKVSKVFTGGERFFRSELAIQEQAPVIFLKGQVNVGERSEGQVQILGVDERFFKMAPGEGGLTPQDRGVGISETLAKALDLKVGDDVVIRMPKPGLLSRDAPLSGEGETILAMRGKVTQIVTDQAFGRFSLEGTQVPPSSIFLPLTRLQTEVKMAGKANLLLVGDSEVGELLLEDYGISVVEVPGGVEIRSNRVFMEPRIVNVIREKLKTRRVLTYLVNTLKSSRGETPYSMVTAVEEAGFLPGLEPGEVILNDWLAEDLDAKLGEKISMAYFALDGGSRLIEKSASFKVKAIIPLVGEAADRRWMPDFPGVVEVESARDWEPGLPLDLKRIRDKDDEYWKRYKGTPKAWLSYADGLAHWENRWGSVTGLRVPGGVKEEVETVVTSVLQPSLGGMRMLDFKAQALAAAQSPVDFAGLFLSMGFFLIVAALVLVAMLFRFNVEQRRSEGGLLSALGIPMKKVHRWRLGEAFLVILLGGIIGSFLAVGFCALVLKVIGSIWGGAAFSVRVNPVSVLGGLLALIVLNLVMVWWTSRKQAKQSAGMRFGGIVEDWPQRGKWKMAGFAVGVVLMGAGLFLGPPLGFFLMGVGCLILGLSLFRHWLGAGKSLKSLTPKSLALVNLGRQKSRGYTVVMVLAMGIFMVLSVAGFRKDGGESGRKKEGGAGGFGLWVETTAPVNRPADALGEVQWFGSSSTIPIRVGAGDNVDCFNLTSSRNPRLLGVSPDSLEGRFSPSAAWSELKGDDVPALVDETTLLWVLKKKVGDTLEYQDEWGGSFLVTIVGVLKDSIFQGSLIVDERKLLKKYPSGSGYQIFLVEREEERIELQKETADLGGKVSLTRDRLAAFHEVENTYIAIFNVLGSLGMILASVGVGVVTARNLFERKEEFQVLEVLGISKERRKTIVLSEVKILILWGLGIGGVSSLISILPLLSKTISPTDLALMFALLCAMGLVAWGSAVLAYRINERLRR